MSSIDTMELGELRASAEALERIAIKNNSVRELREDWEQKHEDAREAKKLLEQAQEELQFLITDTTSPQMRLPLDMDEA